MQIESPMSTPELVTSVARAPATPAIDPSAAIPMADWASLALRAGRVGPNLPNMGWLLRFPDAISREELEAEARRMAAAPYGFGRRVAPPRLPAGRPRWTPAPEPPPVVLAGAPVAGSAGLAAWLDRQLAVPLDPEYDAGWQIAATPTDDGGTAVLVSCHHLFGTARGVLGALYGTDDDPTIGTTETPFTSESTFTTREEARGIGERLKLGFRGLGQLPGDLLAALRGRRDRAPQDGPPALKPPRGRDRTRLPTSTLRVAAIASFPGSAWDEAAARHGGSGNTLLAAVSANLLRRARLARGGSGERTLRLSLPVDLSSREVADTGTLSSGPKAQMTTAAVILPGGPPAHGDMRELRARMKAAFLADTGTAPVVRGAGDAMRLLPEPVTFQFAAYAAKQFDGCASNVGVVPDGMPIIASHRATDMAMLGFPIGNEALTCLIRYGDRATVAVVTDPQRLGPAADLRAWLAEELGAWGLTDVLW
jgi:diacylglycerol O-acyltransferase / wax synthase